MVLLIKNTPKNKKYKKNNKNLKIKKFMKNQQLNFNYGGYIIIMQVKLAKNHLVQVVIYQQLYKNFKIQKFWMDNQKQVKMKMEMDL